MIDNKFLFFRTQRAFENQKNRGNISDNSIVFIKDAQTIWTHGTYFVAKGSLEKSKGFFESLESLEQAISSPEIGDWAIVNTNNGWYVASCTENGAWTLTPNQYKADEINLSSYAKLSDLNDYVHVNSLSDYVTISDLNNLYQIINQNKVFVDDALSETSANPVQNKVITQKLSEKANTEDLQDYVKIRDMQNFVDQSTAQTIRQIEKAKGYYDTLEELVAAVPNPEIGDWAVISVDGTLSICKCNTAGEWTQTDQEFKQDALDLSLYVKTSQLNEIHEDIDSLNTAIDYIKDEYIKWGNSEQGGESNPSGNENLGSKLITLTTVEYQRLVDTNQVQNDVYYFTYEGPDSTYIWKFGDVFPVIFSNAWNFGDAFPINLT